MASEGLVPGGQHLAGLRVQVDGAGLVPDRQPVPVEPDRRRGGPPHLVVGRGDHLAQFAAGDGAAQRHVHVRRETALRLDGGEVLKVTAAVAAQVLDEPVEQRGEVQRVPRGRHIVIAVRINRGAVAGDAPVGRAGEGKEQRRAEHLAVRRRVGLADRPRINLAARQRRGVLPPPGRAVPPRSVGCHVAAHPSAVDLFIEFAEQLVQVLAVLPRSHGTVTLGLDVGALLDPPLLVMGGRVGLEVGFTVEVPAFAALRGAQVLGAFGARRADARRGCARRAPVPVRFRRWPGQCGAAAPGGCSRRG